MDLERLREFCLMKPGVTEDFPFGEKVLVFKVRGKMVLLMNLEAEPVSVNMKCDPTRAQVLRADYEAVLPGYHMNKRHWNTVLVEGDVPDALLLELVDHSYERVVAGLPRRTREELAAEAAEMNDDVIGY